MTRRPSTDQPPPGRLAFLAKPWWLVVIAVAIAFAAACWTILAPWQFDRSAEQNAQNTAISAALTSPAVPVGEQLPVGRQPDASASWRLVTATGEFDTARQTYVRLRQDPSGMPSTEVLVPFRLDDGTVVLVDRGYFPETQVKDGIAPAAPPAGRITITGRVQRDQPDPLNRAALQQNGMTLITGIDSGAPIQGIDPASVRRGFVQLAGGSPGVLTEIGVPQLETGPYLSYALQWCAFGAIALLAIGYFVYREATDPQHSDDETDVAATDPEPAPEPVAAGRAKPKFDRSQLYD